MDDRHQSTDPEPAHVIDHIFVGSKAHAKDLDLLKKLKITHILNVTPTKKIDPIAGVPNFFEKDKSFEYRRCPLYDNKAEDITGALDGCVGFMEHAKFYGRVLVHCSKGVSRSVSMVVAYLVKNHNMSYADALHLVQSKRRIAQPNPSFEKQLTAYAGRMERLRKRKAIETESRNPSSSSSSSSSVKKTRGVAVGPSMRPAASKSIGPQLPPHLMKRQADAKEEKGEAEEQDQDQDQADEETTTSGPELVGVSSNKRKARDAQDEHVQPIMETNKKLKKAGPMIGPARPPPPSDHLAE